MPGETHLFRPRSIKIQPCFEVLAGFWWVSHSFSELKELAGNEPFNGSTDEPLRYTLGPFFGLLTMSSNHFEGDSNPKTSSQDLRRSLQPLRQPYTRICARAGRYDFEVHFENAAWRDL